MNALLPTPDAPRAALVTPLWEPLDADGAVKPEHHRGQCPLCGCDVYSQNFYLHGRGSVIRRICNGPRCDYSRAIG